MENMLAHKNEHVSHQTIRENWISSSRTKKNHQGVNGNKNNLGKSIKQIKWNNDPQVHRISRESFNLIFNGWIFYENVAQSLAKKPNN